MRSWKSMRAPCSAVALIALVAVGVSILPEPDATARGAGTTPRTVDAPVRTAPDAVAASPRPTARPRVAAPRRADVPAASVAVFGGLGAWLDQFDYELNVRRVIRTLEASGVRTLYLQTGYTRYRFAVDPDVGPWLRAAHRAGIDVVGWYLPDYSNMSLDVKRTLAIRSYSYRGHRFDGIGIDIETKRHVRGWRWNKRVARHAHRVRVLLGKGYPLAAITPTPLQMRVAPGFWTGFPWESLARSTDAFLLMSYWSDRIGCPRIRRHCAYEFTGMNVRLTRRLSGSSDAVVHVVGGIGDRISRGQLVDFALAASRSKANGASIYDVATTPRGFWRVLRRLQSLR